MRTGYHIAFFCYYDVDCDVLCPFQDNEVMIRIFNGIRPAVVALILFPCISAVRALKLKYIQLMAPLIATVLIWQFGLSPIYVVLAGIAGGLVYTLWLKDKIKDIKA